MQDRDKRVGTWLITAAVGLLILTAALTHS
jgi:hypothetical protein